MRRAAGEPGWRVQMAGGDGALKCALRLRPPERTAGSGEEAPRPGRPVGQASRNERIRTCSCGRTTSSVPTKTRALSQSHAPAGAETKMRERA